MVKEKHDIIDDSSNLSTEIEEILKEIDNPVKTEEKVRVKVLPNGFQRDNNGLIGYNIKGEWILEPQFDDIDVIKQGRILVTKNGKKGVYTINGNKPTLLIPIIFKNLTIGKKNKYRTELGFHTYTEEFLGNALYNTGQYLIVKGEDCKKLYFLDKLIATYHDIIHLDGNVFIVQNRNGKYGLIRLESFREHTIRAMEYDKIELDSDKDTILLYKNSHARPRFIALHTLVSETKKQDN